MVFYISVFLRGVDVWDRAKIDNYIKLKFCTSEIIISIKGSVLRNVTLNNGPHLFKEGGGRGRDIQLSGI